MLPKPPQGYLERSQADSLLTSFVYGQTFDAPTPLPKRATPAQVDEFVKKALDDDKLTSRQVIQAGELMRFFDLRPRAAQLDKRLDRREREEDEFVRSLTCVGLLGDLGDDALQQRAAEYYKFLVSRKTAEAYFERLVDLFFHLPEKADPKWIADVLDARCKALEPDIKTDVDARVAYHAAKDLKESRLARILEAKKRRHELLAVKDPGRRRQDLARCYLGLEVYAYVRIHQWAAMILQHECNVAAPPDLAAVFSQLLDVFMAAGSIATADGAALDKDEQRACVTTCDRALEFYLGKPTDKQAEFIKKWPAADQNDLLYWEPESAS